MAATLDQILTSLNSTYQPQIQSVQNQQAALPAQFDAQTQGVNAQKNDAFTSILNGARARGTGVAFGGIPLQEQAQYTASTYAPALANLQTSQNNQQQSLTDALNKINENKMQTANGMYQFGVQQDQAAADLAEKQREFNIQEADAQKAAAASRGGLGGDFSGYNGGGGGTSPAPSTPNSPTAQPQWIGNDDVRGRLAYAAHNGNSDAAIALRYVGNDGRYYLNPSTTNPSVIAALNRVNAKNAYTGPSIHQDIMNGVNHLLHNNIFTGYSNSGAAQALAAQKAAHGGHL